MDGLTLLLVIVAAEVLFLGLGGVGVWIAGEKSRSVYEGFFLGFLLGPLGLIIAAVLPSKITPR